MFEMSIFGAMNWHFYVVSHLQIMIKFTI